MNFPYLLLNICTYKLRSAIKINHFITKRSICITDSYQNKWGTKKKHRNVLINLQFNAMADPKIEEVLAPLRANVKEQVLFFIHIQYIKFNIKHSSIRVI